MSSSTENLRSDDLRLRAARVAELPALSALCLRSKAVHGYDADFMAACREELTLTPDDLERDPVIVAESGGTAIGVAQVSMDDDGCFLEKLFVEPDIIGSGAGGRLFDWAVEAARGLGAQQMIIESDPGAEGFYLAQGARRAGEAPSGSVPGRVLPRLVYDLAQRR